jgi:hypothetical protein
MELWQCVVCGGKLGPKHQCPESLIRARNATMKAERTTPQEPSYQERLSTGFFLLSLAYPEN